MKSMMSSWVNKRSNRAKPMLSSIGKCLRMTKMRKPSNLCKLWLKNWKRITASGSSSKTPVEMRLWRNTLREKASSRRIGTSTTLYIKKSLGSLRLSSYLRSVSSWHLLSKGLSLRSENHSRWSKFLRIIPQLVKSMRWWAHMRKDWEKIWFRKLKDL